MDEIKNLCSFLVAQYQKTDLEDLVLSKKKILKSVLKKQDTKTWTGYIYFSTRTSGELLLNDGNKGKAARNAQNTFLFKETVSF